jgi:hypothetical protein
MYVRGIGDHEHELAYVGVLYKGCCNLRAIATVLLPLLLLLLLLLLSSCC